MSEIIDGVYIVLRMVVFAFALGLTLLSYQSYSRQQSEQLEAAFIGFAFLSMGVALTAMRAQMSAGADIFAIAETVPFIIGFGMLYISLYR